MNKIEILIIDDEPQIRKLLEINLESNGYKTISASTGKEGLLFAANHPPELILLDLGLPDMNGHEVLKELIMWFNKAIIILSVQNNESDIVNALDNGATDYLSKPFRIGELMARIRSSLRKNENDENNSILSFDDIVVDFISRIVKKDNEILKLTSTEFKLISILAKNEGRVLTHQFLLKEIWGIGFVNETQYLRVFVAQIRKKIEKTPINPKHIITESGVGYRFC